MLTATDVIIAGFHEPVFAPQDKASNTEAMIAAMAQGTCISSATPATRATRSTFPPSAAAKYEVALELNNSSFTHSRKGSEANCRTIAAAVRDAGGWLALGSDSHVAFSLGNFEHCERIIEEVGFPQERILNVSPRRLLDFLERRGKPAIAELADL